MILEGIVTTLNEDGSPNISPMGPIVDESMQHMLLRPFQTSRTFRNLKRTRVAVLHVTDDVELLAHAAVSQLTPLPRLKPAATVEGVILADACRWYELRVAQLDESDARSRIECEVVARGRGRDFFGFNRAKHAVVETAILATRLHLLPPAEIRADLKRYAAIVDKTAGEQEQRAFQFLLDYVNERIAADP